MRKGLIGLAATAAILSGCWLDDGDGSGANVINIAELGGGGESFYTPAGSLLEALAVGLDQSEGTLRLPVQLAGVAAAKPAATTIDTFPYIWVANSGENTISKIDIQTGVELGVYATVPDYENSGVGNPSRTTVDQDGNVWVGNRNSNTIVKVGLKEYGQCVDRNNNGVIDTSTGRADIKAWTGSDVTGAADECILKFVALQADGITTPSDIRTVAIDPDNHVFVGGNNQRSIFKVDGKTGAILAAVEPASDKGQSLYGGVVDKNGNLWSMSSGSGKVQKTSPDLQTTELINIGHYGYGIAIDKYGKVWTTEYGTDFSAFDPADPVGTLKVFTQTGSTAAQGIATDDSGDIFIAGSLSGSVVGHYRQVFEGNAFAGVEFVRNYPVGSGPTGVAVDGAGRVWSTNANANSVSRITLNADPLQAAVDTYNVGVYPYNYSDMTGRVVRTITNRQGTWEAVFDAGKDSYAWGRVIWTLKAALAEGNEIEVVGKAANAASLEAAKAAFGSIDYINLENDVQLQGLTGRYLKLRIRLTSDSLSETPEVISLVVR